MKMKLRKKALILITAVLVLFSSCNKSGGNTNQISESNSGEYFTSHEIPVPEGMIYYQNLSCDSDGIYVSGISTVTQPERHIFTFDTKDKTLTEMDISMLSDSSITAVYNDNGKILTGSRNGAVSVNGTDVFNLPPGKSVKSFYINETNELIIISADTNSNFFAFVYDNNTYRLKDEYDFQEICEMDFGEYALNVIYIGNSFCFLSEQYRDNIRNNDLYVIPLDKSKVEKMENILPDTKGYYENSYINKRGNICFIFRDFIDSSVISIDEIEITSGKRINSYEDTFTNESIMTFTDVSEDYDFIFWDEEEIYGYDADNVNRIKIIDKSYSDIILTYCYRTAFSKNTVILYSEDIKNLDSPVMIKINGDGILQNKVLSSDYTDTGRAEKMIRLSDGKICVCEYDGEKYIIDIIDENGNIVNSILPCNENYETFSGDIFPGRENDFYFIQKYNNGETKINISVYNDKGEILRCSELSDNTEDMTVKGAFKYQEKDYLIYEYYESGNISSYASEVDYSENKLKERQMDGILGICANNPELYYYTDDSIMKYNGNVNNNIIINWLDSDIINPVSIVCRENDNRYYCITYNQMGYHLLQLDKADEETVKKIKNKQIIQLAGVDLHIGYINSEIEKFNSTNENFRIKVTDYSASLSEEDYDEGINKLNLDIVSGKVPDIFIGNADLDLKVYASKGLFTDLNTYIKNDKSVSRSDYLENILDCFTYNEKQLMFPLRFRLYSLVGQSGVVGEKQGWTYNEFFELAKTRNILWKPTYDILSEVLIYSNISDFIDYDNKKCYFDNGLFEQIIEYIAENGISERVKEKNDEEMYSKRYSEGYCCAEIINTSNPGLIAGIQNGAMGGEKISYKGVPVSEGNGMLAVPYPLIAISEQSESKEGAWEFVKQLISDDYQDIEFALPVKKSSFDRYISQPRFRAAYVDRPDGSAYKTKSLTDDDIRSFSQAVKNIDHIYSTDSVAVKIIEEQLMLYLNNEQTVSETVTNVQNKVALYLSEIK